jgi:hypothetical protein
MEQLSTDQIREKKRIFDRSNLRKRKEFPTDQTRKMNIIIRKSDAAEHNARGSRSSQSSRSSRSAEHFFSQSAQIWRSRSSLLCLVSWPEISSRKGGSPAQAFRALATAMANSNGLRLSTTLSVMSAAEVEQH